MATPFDNTSRLVERNQEKMAPKMLDFLCIGAGKSGTTSLFQYLRFHPQIYIPAEKELPFFSEEHIYAQGWDAFRDAYFADAPVDRLWGKITPQYMGDPCVPERIRTLMPDVKLIALLRNPVDRAYSYYRMQLRSNKPVPTFDKMIAAQLSEEALARARTLPVMTELLDNTIVARGEYGRILQQYLDYFPRSQLLVVFTEEFERDPQTTLDKILAHVGLPTGYTPPNLGKKYHRGGTKQRLPWLIPAARRLTPLRFLWKLLSRRRRRVIYTWYRRELNVVVEENDCVPPSTREQLVAFYRPDMRRLAAIAERSLPWPEFESQG